MSKAPGRTAPGVLCAVRAGYGALLLCAPGRMISLAAGHPAGPRAAGYPAGPRAADVARMLGARHLLQAAATAAVLAGAGPEPARSAGLRPGLVLLAGSAVDAVHAASMIGFAAVCRSYRRPVLSDVLLEAGFAAFGIITGRRQPGSPRSRASLLIDG